MDNERIPTESAEQQALFIWARVSEKRWPELALMHHIPNGGARNKATAGRLKAEGVKAGVPDICLPVARGGCHGLYIEMKRIKGGRLSAEQAEWMERLAKAGYCVAVCNGWEEAARTITDYLKGKIENERDLR